METWDFDLSVYENLKKDNKSFAIRTALESSLWKKYMDEVTMTGTGQTGIPDSIDEFSYSEVEVERVMKVLRQQVYPRTN